MRVVERKHRELRGRVEAEVKRHAPRVGQEVALAQGYTFRIARRARGIKDDRHAVLEAAERRGWPPLECKSVFQVHCERRPCALRYTGGELARSAEHARA